VAERERGHDLHICKLGRSIPFSVVVVVVVVVVVNMHIVIM